VVFVIGLLAGGAGLAGSLAQDRLTLFTLGSAVGVGLVAAIVGKSQPARVLGWLFAAVMGQFFVLTVAIAGGLERSWAAFGVLAVGAALLILEAALPRLGLPQYRVEAMTVEWSGYASALLAGALAYDSPAHLAALFSAWGAVLGLAATRRDRRAKQRRVLFWTAIGFEIVGWWMFIALADVAVPEAYTLPFAAMALLVGIFEARTRPDLSSWAAYGPALLAAFVPTVGIVLATQGGEVREVLLLLGAVGTLIVGSVTRQQAPVVVGAAATVVAALHFAMTLVGPWLVLVPVGTACSGSCGHARFGPGPPAVRHPADRRPAATRRRPPRVGERLRATTQSLESALFDVLTEARLRGEIPAGRSPEDLAAFLVTTLQGLRVRGAVNPDRSTLMRSAEVALACLG
jgi:hypothetical protein